MDATNGTRFIQSYNHIEECLRSRYNLKATQSFTDLINRCADFDLTVRRYKDELVDCGKLRNAIVHKSRGDKIMAYPSDEVVGMLEIIEKQICTPPVLFDILKPKKLMYVFGDSPLRQAMLYIARSKHTSLPVYGDGKVLGIINSYTILKHIGNALEQNNVDVFINTTTCASVIDDDEIGKEYKFIPKTATIFDAFRAFEVGKKTLAVFITETGKFGERILNMVTSSDLPLLNKFIETY